MKIQSLLVLAFASFGAGCAHTSSSVPDICKLPAGVSVSSMALDESQAGELPATGEKGFSVTAGIKGTSNQITMVCFAVRDVDFPTNPPIAAGIVGVSPNDSSATRDNVFNLTCRDGKVAGRSVTSAGGLDAMNGTTNERSSKVFVQHVDSVKTLFGKPVGISGEKSNSIKVSCPQ